MGGGGGVGGFIEDTIDSVSGGIADLEDTTKQVAADVRANDVYDWASNLAGSAANMATLGLYDLATEGQWSPEGWTKDTLNTVTAGGVHAQEKAILDPRRSAERAADREAAGAQAAAEQAKADAERARAAAVAALPKDPTVDEIVRQRRARGGRRGTILTTPGNSLGTTEQGKSLLGL